MRKQVKFVFQVGYQYHGGVAPNVDRFEHDVISKANWLCGGCTTDIKQGHWVEGETHAERFEGEAIVERCFQLELTTEPHKADEVLTEMQHAMAYLSMVHEVKTDWVHCSETEIVGRHFSLEAMRAAITAPIAAE